MEKETKSTLVFLGSTHFLIHVISHVISQLLPAIIPILRVEFGIASIIFGAASLVGLAATLGGGALGDTLRRRTSYLLVIAGMVLSVALIPFAITLLLVAVLYMLWRGLYSASMPLTNMLIADTSPLEVRGVGYSTLMMVSNVVSISSLMGVSWLMEASGVEALFTASAVLLGISFILILLYRSQ